MTGESADSETKNESNKPALISRRSLLKKSAYQAPTLLVLSSLVSVANANNLSFPGQPGVAPPGVTGRPPRPGDPPPGD